MINTMVFSNVIRDIFSAVRSVTWGDGCSIFATASDPFNTREQGLISVFEFPTDGM